MEYTTLGATGTEVSRLCLGTWRFAVESGGTVETTREEAHALLDAAHEAGINFIDTANVYGDPPGTAERWIGEWLADRDREEVVLASKVYGPMADRPNGSGLGRKHVRDQITASLDRLGTDYLDLYYIHRWDDETPIRETLRTLDDLVREGKVNHLGASSMAAWQLTRALWESDTRGIERFEVTQPRFNAAYRREDDLAAGGITVESFLDVCADQALAVCPYSPLERGFLTGKYERGGEPPAGSRGDLNDWSDQWGETQWRVLKAAEAVADEADATPAQVALRWLIERDRFTCVPIVGARTPAQLEENAGAADLSLSADQIARVTEAYDGDD